MMCFQYFLFLFVFPCLSVKQGSTTAMGHQSKDSPLLNGTTTLFYTNMTDLQLKTPPANLTTPQPKGTTQQVSTMARTSHNSQGAATQEAGSTTSSQQRAEIKPSKSTTKQQSTTGRSQSKMPHGICRLLC